MTHLYRIRFGLCNLSAVATSLLEQWAQDATAANMPDVKDKIGCEVMYRGKKWKLR